MKKFIIILLACLMAFAFVSCEDEPEQEVIENLSMADASRIAVVFNAIMNGDGFVSNTDKYSEYVCTKMPVKHGSQEFFFTGTVKTDEIKDTMTIEIKSLNFVSGTDYENVTIEINVVDDEPQIAKVIKNGKEVTSPSDEYTSITDMYKDIEDSLKDTFEEYSNFSNEYCKVFSREIYVTTTETDCYSDGLVSRGAHNKVYVGKLSEGATYTKITRNDNERTREINFLATPDSEFILEAKLNDEDFNVSFSTVDNIAVINGKSYHATIDQFEIPHYFN